MANIVGCYTTSGVSMANKHTQPTELANKAREVRDTREAREARDEKQMYFYFYVCLLV
jgi:hypothetical protein